MCGLVGAYAKEVNSGVLKAVGYLSFFNQLRGTHSTGIAAMYNDGDTDLIKGVGSYMKLIEDNKNDFNGLSYLNYAVNNKDGKLEDVFPYCVMVHGRHATQGEVNLSNAQPFTFKNLTGTHNGTLKKDYYEKLKTYRKNRSDSHAFFEHLNSSKDDLKDTLKNVKGAFAFVWHNNKTREITLTRNYERPLSIASVYNGKVILWASEKWMLTKTLQMCDIPEKDYEVREIGVRECLTLGIGKDGKVEVRDTFSIPYVAPNPVSTTAYDWSSYRYDGPKGNVVPVWIPHVDKSVIHRDRWNTLTEGGCAVCNKNLDVKEHADVKWYDANTPLCKDCAISFADDLKGVG